MLKIRVTDLDQWVRFLEPERDEFEVPLADFIAYLKREAPQTEDMRCGAAFHALMEGAGLDDELGGTFGSEQDGFRFYFQGEFSLALTTAREQLVERVYETPNGPVLLRGKTDGRRASEVVDYKLTTSPFDAERYASSLQWRAYLDMTQARSFRYVVFKARRDGSDVWIHEQHELVLWPYPEMHADVSRRVAELAQFIHGAKLRGLLASVEERVSA